MKSMVMNTLKGVAFTVICCGMGALFALAMTSPSGSLYTDAVNWYQSK